jgi:hypothetical protein
MALLVQDEQPTEMVLSHPASGEPHVVAVAAARDLGSHELADRCRPGVEPVRAARLERSLREDADQATVLADQE